MLAQRRRSGRDLPAARAPTPGPDFAYGDRLIALDRFAPRVREVRHEVERGVADVLLNDEVAEVRPRDRSEDADGGEHHYHFDDGESSRRSPRAWVGCAGEHGRWRMGSVMES